jgi:hypothetical protein
MGGDGGIGAVGAGFVLTTGVRSDEMKYRR